MQIGTVGLTSVLELISKFQMSSCSNALFIQGNCIMLLCFPSGLTDLLHYNRAATIEPVQPGHIESYILAPSGKATFQESIRFHKIGEPPVYKTLAPLLGEYKSRIMSLYFAV